MRVLCLRPYVEVELSDDGRPTCIKVDWCETFASVWDSETQKHDYMPTDNENELLNRLVLPNSLPLVMKEVTA